MKIVVIDGQGGRMGKMVVEQLRVLPSELIAIGNSIATAAMLKAGADFGATGENQLYSIVLMLYHHRTFGHYNQCILGE